MMEIFGVVQGIDYLVHNLRRFMRPTRRHIALPLRFGTNRIEYQPLGVVGVISPSNYPVNLSLMPVVTAIAAGNRVMLKPSKLTPATNAVLAAMLSELFPPEQVTIVSGDGSAFSDLPFDGRSLHLDGGDLPHPHGLQPAPDVGVGDDSTAAGHGGGEHAKRKALRAIDVVVEPSLHEVGSIAGQYGLAGQLAADQALFLESRQPRLPGAAREVSAECGMVAWLLPAE